MNWYYISGFFDADGSITATARGKSKSRALHISFHNNELNILNDISKFIEKELGFKGIISCKKAKKENHSDAYTLVYSYRQAVEVANNLTSYHPKKWHRIEVYKRIQEVTKRNGKYTDEEFKERQDLIKEFFQI